jgi:hypothetical protein
MLVDGGVLWDIKGQGIAAIAEDFGHKVKSPPKIYFSLLRFYLTSSAWRSIYTFDTIKKHRYHDTSSLLFVL